jgi:hypothetical protein
MNSCPMSFKALFVFKIPVVVFTSKKKTNYAECLNIIRKTETSVPNHQLRVPEQKICLNMNPFLLLCGISTEMHLHWELLK